MKYFFKRLTLRISWTCVVWTNWTGFRVATHGNYSNLHERSFNLFLFSAYSMTATLSIEPFTVQVSLSAEVLSLVPMTGNEAQ